MRSSQLIKQDRLTSNFSAAMFLLCCLDFSIMSFRELIYKMAAFSCVSVRTHRRSSRRSMTLVAITPQSVDKAGKVLKLKLSTCILLVSSFSSNVYKVHLTKCNCLCNFQISIFFQIFDFLTLNKSPMGHVAYLIKTLQ